MIYKHLTASGNIPQSDVIAHGVMAVIPDRCKKLDEAQQIIIEARNMFRMSVPVSGRVSMKDYDSMDRRMTQWLSETQGRADSSMEVACPRCGHYDLAPVDSIPGNPIVACNQCDLYFNPKTKERVQG